MIKNLSSFFFKKLFERSSQPIDLIHKIILYSAAFLNLVCTQAYADGSKDLFPAGATGVRAFMMSSSNSNTPGFSFMTLGVHYAYVKEGESIAAASSVQGSSLGKIILTAPDGQVYSTIPTSREEGRIDNRIQELAGPNVDGVTTGYVPFRKVAGPGQQGLWTVAFLPAYNPTSALNLGNVSELAANINWVTAHQTNKGNGILAWDVSVISSADKLISGRVYSNVMNLAAYGRYFGKLFVLTNDGYVYKVTNNGIDGYRFAYFVNNKGITSGAGDDAEPIYKSIQAQSNLNIKDPRTADGAKSITHKMFYTFPDASMPSLALTPDGNSTWLKVPKIIPAVTSITIEGIEGTLAQVSGKGARIRFNTNIAGRYRINLAGAGSFVPMEITGNAKSGTNEVFWDGKDGAGNTLPAGTATFTVKVQLQGAEVHFPFIDVEKNIQGIVIEQFNDDGTLKPGGDIVYWDDTGLPQANSSSNPRFNGNDGAGISSNTNGHIWGELGGDGRTMDTWAYTLGDAVSQNANVEVKIADLEVQSITPSTTTISAGGTVTFTVPVVNHGPSDVTGAPFKFKVPPGFIIANATSAVTYATACEGAVVKSPAIDASGNYTALLDLTGNNCKVVFTITGKVGSGFTGTNLDVEASIMRPADVTDPDATNPDPGVLPTDPHVECLNGTASEGCNNIKYNSLPVSSSADIVTLKSTAATEYIPGENVVYTIAVRNDGPSDAAAVSITDLASAGTAISGWTAAVTTGTINLPATSGTGNLNQIIPVFPNGAAVTYSITLEVDPTHTTSLVNTANAISASTADPDQNNNTSIAGPLLAVPDAPIGGGTQSACATNPVQTLTATATVPAGITITWYDAPSGGNVIASPVLNTLGTVVYYAEANNSGVKSRSRTPVILSLNASPLIDALANQNACVSYTLPPITGTNLTGNQAYYTQPNGGGTKYAVGTALNTVGVQTLYLFDKAVANAACAGNVDVTPNTSLSDNVLMHQTLSTTHDFYPRAVNADFWKGTASQIIDYNSSEGSMRYLNLVGDLNISSDPACTSSQVQVTIGATFKNEGPAVGAGYSGHLSIVNKLTGVMLYTSSIQTAYKVGVSNAYTFTTTVSAADLLAGNLVVILGVETAQDGYKSWTLSDFKATYSYLSETPCPDEKSFQLTINALPAAPVNNGNQEVCATTPVQALTATATVPTGTTVVWYDAATGGNVVTAPILNTIGTVIYYAEAVSNTCVSATRTPVTLTINQSPVINAIADINACGSLTLPAIAGANLSGNQAYYTGINKTGTKYNPGDVISTPGETTLYAYDEILAGAAQNPEGNLTLTNITNLTGGYTNAKLQALYPDQTRAFPRLGTLNGDPAVASSFLSFLRDSPASARFGVSVGKLTLPVGHVNEGDQVLVSLENAWIRNWSYPQQAVPGYAGQIAIINTATNQLLYQTPFNDVPVTGITPSVAGLIPAADLIAGNIGVYLEFGNDVWRVSGLTATYQFVSNAVGCPAQQSFKVNISPIPSAPVASNQTVCADVPVQTLTATATVPSGSTVVWYDAVTAGNVVATPTLNAVGTITYYAETHTGDCVSATRKPVVLTINAQPVLTVNHPAVVCHPNTIDLTAAGITAGSTADLQLAYFTDAAATIVLANPAAIAVSGTYYIKGTNAVTGCSIIAPVVVQFVDRPEVIAVHPDCVSATGSITITSPLGVGFEYSIDGSTYQTGTAFNNLPAGSYNVTARNTVVLGCVSEPNIIVINSTLTTAMPVVVQPGCDETQGSVLFPVNAAYEYSMDGAAFTTNNEFAGLNPGVYSFRSKRAGDVCIADAVSVTIVPGIGRPAPPTGSDLQACETTNPVQTLMAVATPPDGSTLKWYDAPTGGNLVSSPTLSTVGTVVYYAESSTAICTSTNRTPVRLAITPVPVINVIADKNVCGPLTLPVIAGTGLSGNQAYYTAQMAAVPNTMLGICLVLLEKLLYMLMISIR